ncbi:Brix domain-containing protein F44G4.1 [Galdieria sulphuraria]|nr:Brix domain-containing protein F44G4.1 [Galdieria sulphuraria]
MKELPKNKIRRSKIRQETKEAEARGEDWRKPPLTLEDKRVQIFSDVFSGAVIPKVVVVPGLKATRMTYNFISELLQIIPNSVFYERKKSSLNQASVKAAEKGFTDVIFTEENRKQITGLFHVHLPHGPCAYYSIRSYVPCKKVVGHGRSTASKPEVILSHFTTQLGIRIARMLGALFALEPEYSGRQVVTLHNQRDFIFFRFHRYQFDDRGVKVSLQEQGPRFTLQYNS